MKTSTLLLSSTLIFAFSGCCTIKSIEIEPHINNIDIKTATIDSAYAKLKFELNECCPTSKQKETIEFLESQTRVLYVKLINDEITLKDYNNKIAGAKNAIESVILYCTAKPTNTIPSLETNSTRILSKSVKRMTQEEAWLNLDTVAKGL